MRVSRRSRIWASASFSAVGDFVRIVAAAVLANASSGPVGIERGENIFDAVTVEQPVDRRRRCGASFASPGRFGKGRERGVDRDRAAQRLGEIGKPRRRHPMGGDLAATPSAAPSRSPVSAQYAPSSPGSRGRNQVAPTSGKKPMPTSGMANRKRSPATRCEPCTDTPTPPPMQMPSISAT